MADPLFGGYAPQLSPQRTATALPMATPEDYGAGVGDALTGAGGVAGRAAIDDRKLETQREYDRQATDAMLRMAQLKEAYGLADNEARTNAGPGAAGYAKSMTELAAKQSEEFLASIGHEGLRQAYSSRLGDWKAERAVQADAFERGSTAKLMADQMDASADAMANSVRGKPLADYVETLSEIETVEVPKGIPEGAVLEWRRGAAQKATFAWLRSQEPEARKAMIDSHTFDTLLTSEQVEAVLSEADSDIRRKQVEADAAARAAKAEDVEYVDDVLDRINRGYPVEDEDYAEAMTRATRSGLDKRVRDLNDAHVGKQVNKEWASATPAQMDQRIKIIDAELAKAGDKGNPALVAERAALDKLLIERKKQVANDPLAAGAAMGIRVEPVDWADPASVAARRKAADATARAMGVPAKYLSDEEATQLAANADTPAGQLAVARQLRALGPMAAKAAAQQVLPGDALFAYSMGLRPEVQQGIFRGKGLRKEYPVPEDQASLIWRDSTGNALARLPEASREAAYLSAKDLYRQAASRAGKDEFDPKLFRGAVREALGGNVHSRTGGIGEWNDAKIMLPSDMSQQQFDARLGGFKPTEAYDASGRKIGGNELRSNFVPQLQPDGRYRFVSRRGEVAVRKDGRTPYSIDVSKLAPAAAVPKAQPVKPQGAFYGAPPGRMKFEDAVVPKGPQPRASGV